MGLFGNTVLTIKKRADIIEFLKRIQSTSHLISTSIETDRTHSILLQVRENLYFNNFFPAKTNQEFTLNKLYKFHVSGVFECNKLEVDFESAFLGLGLDYDSKSLKFEIPDLIKYTEDIYTIIPTEEDNVSVTFKLRDLPEYRKIILINSKEMHFKAELDYLLKDYNNKMIYNIELKLPLDKILITGTFKKLRKNLYEFENFIFGIITKEALSRYIEFDFQRRTPEIFQHINQNTMINAKIKDSIENQYIFLCDSSRAVTEYFFEYLSKRTQHPIIQTNSCEEIFEITTQYKPFIIIINANSSIIPIKDLVKKIHDLGSLLIIIFNKNMKTDISDIESDLIKAALVKPIDGQTLLNIINKIDEEQL